ncbi:hypothetical protein BaRGS_00003681 [Batillaria attramentaria]|uniref:Uncharacterized protein n=1 Tax=Batillaria attramentaria TaxID=370345 RepID=A0ABD0M1C2_9CAEN
MSLYGAAATAFRNLHPQGHLTQFSDAQKDNRPTPYESQEVSEKRQKLEELADLKLRTGLGETDLNVCSVPAADYI